MVGGRSLGPSTAHKFPLTNLAEDEEPSTFAAHVEPPFRERDRRFMLFAFDL